MKNAVCFTKPLPPHLNAALLGSIVKQNGGAITITADDFESLDVTKVYTEYSGDNLEILTITYEGK